MTPNFVSGLQMIQAGWTRLVTGVAESLPDRTVVGLRAQISFFDGFCRAFSPLRGQGKEWENTAARLESELNRAERLLARRHAENLFSNVILTRLLFETPFGRPEENLGHREDVFRKIDREGMNGYMEVLVAAINQHWAPVLMWETLRGGRFEEEYGEMDEWQSPSVAVIVGLLRAIESDGHVEARFKERWNAFSPLYPLDTVKGRLSGFVARYSREFHSQSLL